LKILHTTTMVWRCMLDIPYSISNGIYLIMNIRRSQGIGWTRDNTKCRMTWH